MNRVLWAVVTALQWSHRPLDGIGPRSRWRRPWSPQLPRRPRLGPSRLGPASNESAACAWGDRRQKARPAPSLVPRLQPRIVRRHSDALRHLARRPALRRQARAAVGALHGLVHGGDGDGVRRPPPAQERRRRDRRGDRDLARRRQRALLPRRHPPRAGRAAGLQARRLRAGDRRRRAVVPVAVHGTRAVLPPAPACGRGRSW